MHWRQMYFLLEIFNFYRNMDLLDSNKYLWDDFRGKTFNWNFFVNNNLWIVYQKNFLELDSKISSIIALKLQLFDEKFKIKTLKAVGENSENFVDTFERFV